MAFAVVTVAAGGLPVVDVSAITPLRGLPVTEATNGRGVPVTLVVGKPGLPVVYTVAGATTGDGGFAGSAMLAGGVFPVVVTGSPGVRQANIGGVQVEE